MRIIQVILAVLLIAVVAPPQARAADSASVRAILITATNQKREADPKLAPYEAELQRNLPLSSFRYVGEGSASVSGSASAKISLGQGNTLEVTRESGGGLRLKCQWMNGSTVMLSTSLSLNPGIPAVLGRRPSGDGETPIILVIAK